MKTSLSKLVSLSVALTMLFAPFTSQARTDTSTTFNLASAQEAQPEIFYKVIAHPGTLDASQEGITLWHDYGTFALYKVSPAALSQLPSSTRSKVRVMTDMDNILLDAYPFNTQTDTFDAIPESLRTTQANDPALHLIQFVGPIKDAWLQAIEDAGAKPIHYIANYGYLVWADGTARTRLDGIASTKDFVQFSAPYHPYFKLGASLRKRLTGTYTPEEIIKVTIQMYDHPGKNSTERLIATLARNQLSPWTPILDYQNIIALVRVGDIETIAAQPDVFWIGEYFERELLDEVQNQILAANFDGSQTGPSGPGYLAWLTSYGFSTNPADYPVVDVTDDGIGNGTGNSGDYTLHELGNITNPTRLQYVGNCTSSADGGGPDGHGHINTSIVGGYDTLTGFPYQDADGFNRGLGVNPYSRLAGTRVFDASGFDLSACSNTDTGLIKQVQDSGAQIASNSWGCRLCAGSYDDSSQAFDTGVRDADLTEPGNQELIFVFSAGNAGPSASTVGTPGNGKNIITVGASENDRPSDEDGSWTDGCGIGPTGADDAMDVIGFSSRGPAPGGRVKPEVIAPGTHIHGTASTHASYNGTGVCDQYRPSGQTVFAASSGTSHSAPAVAGVSSLYYYWLENEYGTIPSPALMKAYLIAHPTYLTGISANDTLPSNSQGYGMPNMTLAFDDTPRYMVNQTELFDNSGEIWTFSGNIVDPGKPVRVVMAYTDQPGAIGTSPEVNDLNLEVTTGGDTYLGNNFSGQWSMTGGPVDGDNNYEAVFLPTGASGQINVTVAAFNIAGDGVPNTGDATDQDFALVIYNVSQEGIGYLDGTIYADGGTPATDPISGADVQADGLVPTHTGHTTSRADGTYRMGLVTDTYTVTVTAYGYQMAEIGNVSVVSSTTTTLSIPLTPAAMYVVSGTITDATTGWPLYASIDISSYPGGTVWTDPETGFYSITLPEGMAYDFGIDTWVQGYEPAIYAIAPLTSDRTENFALSADQNTCTAPGYAFTSGISERFERSFPPAGWTVIDNIGSGGTWNRNDAFGVPNRTGYGSGYSAAAEAYQSGIAWDTELWSPSIDMNGASPQLTYASNFQDYVDNGEIWLDISTNGGANWTNLRYQTLDDPSGGTLETEDLSAYVTNTIILRWRYAASSSTAWYWHIDDVSIPGPCLPQTGGLVIGNVYDANTNAPLAGATVSNDSGESTTAGTTLDPAAADSFYTLFSPAGSHTLTATMNGGYGSDTASVTIVQSDTVRQDFYLPAASLAHAPQMLQVSLLLNTNLTTPFTLTNSGGLTATFELQERNRGFQATSSAPEGTIVWLTRNTAGIPVATSDSGATIAYPGSYRYDPATPHKAANILIYTDDWVHPAPNSYPDQALRALGYAYTAHYDSDFTGFEASLTGSGPWDLVVFANDNYTPPTSTLAALEDYIAGGGKLLLHSWRVSNYSGAPLWTRLGFTWINDVTTGDDVYWWSQEHLIFDGIPEFVGLTAQGGIQGQRTEPLTGFEALAGYTTPGPNPNEAALILGNDGHTVFKGFIDAGNDLNSDGDAALDGVELWMNLIEGIQAGFSTDVPWLSENPITGTVAAGGSQVIDITFDTGKLVQPGQYYAALHVISNDPVNPDQSVPVTMTVQPDPSMGPLHGTVTGDRPGGPLESALVEVISGTVSVFSGTTDATGGYGPWWLMNGTYTVRISADGYLTDTQSVNIVAQQMTTHAVTLTLDAPQIAVVPRSFDETLNWGAAVTQVMTITNSGPAALEFEIGEMEYSFVPAEGSLVIDIPPAKAVAVDEAALHQAEEQESVHGNRYTIENPHLLANGVDVLLVHADSYPTQFEAFLEGYPDINTVDTWDASPNGSIPDLSDLFAYNVVIAWNNSPWVDPDLIGDVLADYHDAGGNVILTVDAWSAGSFRTGGRFIDEEYTPFLSLGGAVFNDVTLGWYDADHPLMDGASTAAAHFHNQVWLSTAAVLVAEWDDSMPFVATKTKNGHEAVGINTYYGNGEVSWTTDAPLIVHNAIAYLFTEDVPWLSEDPLTGTVPAHSATSVTISFDAAQVAQPGVYQARLRVSSNDPYNTTANVPVTMTVQPDPSMGQLHGTVTDDRPGGPLESALVEVISDTAVIISDTTDATGGYGPWWLMNGTYTVRVSAAGHLTNAQGVGIIAQQTITHDVMLTLNAPWIEVTPRSFDETLIQGATTTRVMTITNSGPAALEFELFESAGSFTTTDLPFASGGPDDFGYTYKDSNELGGPQFDFVDISASGTPVSLDDDDHDGPFAIGFDFPFYGSDQTEFYLSSNGFLSFGSGSSDLNNNCPMPGTDPPYNLIALMWDDLDPGNTDDPAYYETFTACPCGIGKCLIVQYDGYHHYPGGDFVAGTWEGILFANGNILIQFEDAGTEEGSNSTTGIANASGSDGLTYGACNTPASLQGGLAICFQYPGAPPCGANGVHWLSEDPITGTIVAGGSQVIDITLDANKVTQAGQYHAVVHLISNDSINPDQITTVTMTVTAPDLIYIPLITRNH
jgi:hypothetical protein